MRNLEVWDKIYYKHIYGLWRKLYSYYFEEIERITKTLIITKSGKKLSNYWYRAVQKSTQWYTPNYVYELVTDEILKDNERVEYIDKIEDWFDKQHFTIEDKIKIHNTLNIF